MVAGEGYRRYIPHLRPTLAGFGSWIAGRPEEFSPTCHPPWGRAVFLSNEKG